MISLTKLKELYFSDSKVVEIKDESMINQMLNSTMSSCWGSGQELEGWTTLSFNSPESLGEKVTVLVCNTMKINNRLH